jgi:hypothetical protein
VPRLGVEGEAGDAVRHAREVLLLGGIGEGPLQEPLVDPLRRVRRGGQAHPHANLLVVGVHLPAPFMKREAAGAQGEAPADQLGQGRAEVGRSLRAEALRERRVRRVRGVVSQRRDVGPQRRAPSGLAGVFRFFAVVLLLAERLGGAGTARARAAEEVGPVGAGISRALRPRLL